MSPVKKILTAGASVSALVLLAASATWACSPMPGNSSLSAGSGEPGAAVEVVGRDFLTRPPDWPGLEVRWNTTAGEVLARVTAPNFRVSVAVPQTAPGQRFVVVVQRNPSGGIHGQVTMPFQVTAPAPRPPAPAPAPAQPMVTQVPVLAPAPQPRGAPSGAPAPVPPAATQGAPASPASSPVAPEPTREAGPAVAPVGAPSLLPSGTEAPAAVAVPKLEVSTPGKAMLVDVRDLWSGVQPGDPAASRSSLLAPSDSRSDAGSRLGAGLLALAGVGLLAGLGVMVLTRRRAAVAAARSRRRSE